MQIAQSVICTTGGGHIKTLLLNMHNHPEIQNAIELTPVSRCASRLSMSTGET